MDTLENIFKAGNLSQFELWLSSKNNKNNLFYCNKIDDYVRHHMTHKWKLEGNHLAILDNLVNESHIQYVMTSACVYDDIEIFRQYIERYIGDKNYAGCIAELCRLRHKITHYDEMLKSLINNGAKNCYHCDKTAQEHTT